MTGAESPARRLVLVGGGARSGKSAFALRRARQLGTRRTFLATAQACDQEMHARIARHRRERRDEFQTLEEPLRLPQALAALRDVEVVVVDCLTLWLSNLLLDAASEDRVLDQVEQLCDELSRRRYSSVVVTNEVGMGLVPESALGRSFRDLAGLTHQRVARHADEIHLAVLGSVLRLRPEPLALADKGDL